MFHIDYGIYDSCPHNKYEDKLLVNCYLID